MVNWNVKLQRNAKIFKMADMEKMVNAETDRVTQNIEAFWILGDNVEKLEYRPQNKWDTTRKIIVN